MPLKVPDTISADSGRGIATTVHLLPNAIDCRKVVFAAEGEDPGGYTIYLDHLRNDHVDWSRQLHDKVQIGPTPALAMLTDALATFRTAS